MGVGGCIPVSRSGGGGGGGGGSVAPYRGLLSWVEIFMQNLFHGSKFHGDSSVVLSSYM